MSKETFQKGFADGFLSAFTFFLAPQRERRRITAFKSYESPDLPDVSVAAAWVQVGGLLRDTMQAEGEKIDAERRSERRRKAAAAKAGKKRAAACGAAG